MPWDNNGARLNAKTAITSRHRHRAGKLERSTGSFDRSRSRLLLYSALAVTFFAFGRVEFAAGLRWLLDLLKPRAIAGGANNFGYSFTRFFHCVQSLKQKTNLNSFAKIPVNRHGATKLPS
jgi:hypothetical protein